MPDLGVVMCSPRVSCPTHGPTVAQVPWARHGAGHTRDFDDALAWLVTHTAKSTVCELMSPRVKKQSSPPSQRSTRGPYRAYLMKEQLRIAIRTRGVLSLTMLEAWLA